MDILRTGQNGLLKDRRSGKDRRRYVDPRYRNAAYVEFVDRRKGERRKLVYEPDCCLIKEHPERKWITRLGIVVGLFLLYLLFLSNLIVSKSVGEGTQRRCTITIGCVERYGEDHRTALPVSSISCLGLHC